MQYVVCIATRSISVSEGNRQVHYRQQFIDCVDAKSATELSELLHVHYRSTGETTAEPGVKVWNGKGWTYIPFDTIGEVYDHMTSNGRSEGKPCFANAAE